MTKIIRNHQRGQTRLDWLESYHIFEFGAFRNPFNQAFGPLVVINHDIIQPAKGFQTHPHRDMEIISIVRRGLLEHIDSLGNKKQMRAGTVQLMSAGTGIRHSEWNGSDEEECEIYQIWIQPNQLGLSPSYQEKVLKPIESPRSGQWRSLVGPLGSQAELHLHQQAWVWQAQIGSAESLSFSSQIHPNSHGLVVLVMSGEISVEGDLLQTQDTWMDSEKKAIVIKALSQSEVLVFDL